MALDTPPAVARTAGVSQLLAELPVAPLVMTLITVGALGLRLSQLDQSLFGDEMLAYNELAGHSLRSAIHLVRTGLESSPPLYFILAWASAKLGDPTIFIRLPSVLFGVATLPVTYLLGRATVGRAAGLVAVAVLAASPFATYYGIEARPYATLGFFVALSTLALVRAVGTGDRRWWVLYVFAAAAAAYTHYTAVFVLLVQAGWSLWAGRRRRLEPLLASAAVVVLYLPWLPELHSANQGWYALLHPLTLSNVVKDTLSPIAGYPYASLHKIPTIAGLVLITIAAALGAFALARTRLRPASKLREAALSRQALILWLSIATPVGVLLYSLLVRDIWDSRDLYASVPAAALVLGRLLVALPRRLCVLAVAITLVTLGLATARAISPGYARPPYRDAAAYLDRVARPADPVVLYTSGFVFDRAIPAQFHRPHRLINGVPRSWPELPAGGATYVVMDDPAVLLEKLAGAVPRNYQLSAIRSYRGLVPFDVLTYRSRR